MIDLFLQWRTVSIYVYLSCLYLASFSGKRYWRAVTISAVTFFLLCLVYSSESNCRTFDIHLLYLLYPLEGNRVLLLEGCTWAFFLFFIFFGCAGNWRLFLPLLVCVIHVSTVTWTLSTGVLQGDFPVYSWDVHKLLWSQMDGYTNPH